MSTGARILDFVTVALDTGATVECVGTGPQFRANFKYQDSSNNITLYFVAHKWRGDGTFDPSHWTIDTFQHVESKTYPEYASNRAITTEEWMKVRADILAAMRGFPKLWPDDEQAVDATILPSAVPDLTSE